MILAVHCYQKFLFSILEAAHAGQLRICRLSKPSSSVAGGEEVFLLCDKVQKGEPTSISISNKNIHSHSMQIRQLLCFSYNLFIFFADDIIVRFYREDKSGLSLTNC